MIQESGTESPSATPYPPSSESASGVGVGPQSTPAAVSLEPDKDGAAIVSAVPAPPSWPEWAPALPTEIPPTPWEAEGRAPRPDERLLSAGPDTPARAPTDYQLPAGLLGDASDPAALVHGKAVQSLLWSAGLPAHEGMAILEAVAESQRSSRGELSDFDFQVKVKQTEATLKRQLGEAEFNRRREALTAQLGEMDRKSGGKLAEFIEDHADVLAEPQVMARLLAHAGRADKRRR